MHIQDASQVARNLVVRLLHNVINSCDQFLLHFTVIYISLFNISMIIALQCINAKIITPMKEIYFGGLSGKKGVFCRERKTWL